MITVSYAVEYAVYVYDGGTIARQVVTSALTTFEAGVYPTDAVEPVRQAMATWEAGTPIRGATFSVSSFVRTGLTGYAAFSAGRALRTTIQCPGYDSYTFNVASVRGTGAVGAYVYLKRKK